MDNTQRKILANQYKILAKIESQNGYKELAKKFADLSLIYENGYSSLYVDDNIPQELSKEDCEFVINILDLYDKLNASFVKLKNSELSEEDVSFKGFDGNNESDLLNFAVFFINYPTSRFSFIKNRDITSLNSHSEKKDRYKKMLEAYINMGKPVSLNEEQIKEIINI